VRPFCFEKTKIINADSLISDRVMDSGIVNPAAAAKGCGDVKLGLAERYVFNGFACGVPILAANMIQERFPVGEYKKHLNARPPLYFILDVHAIAGTSVNSVATFCGHPNKHIGKG
jgi:hypothetical protein